MAEGDQRFGQRFDHVREAARLRERQPFRCDKEYFHGEFEASNVLKRIAAVKNAQEPWRSDPVFSSAGFSLRVLGLHVAHP